MVIRFVDIDHPVSLADYEPDLHLAPLVEGLRKAAAAYLKHDGRRIYVVNSTEAGGGVAEMLPSQVALLRDLGLPVRWVVIEPTEPQFFGLTKRLHNAMHGNGRLRATSEERAIYDRVSRAAADAIKPHLTPRDVVIVHDPQPAGVGAILKQEVGLHALWRCHIGYDETTPSTTDAWEFLQPAVSRYDRCVFSLPEYVPKFLRDASIIIPPAIDPHSDKNREVSVHTVVGVLGSAALLVPSQPTLYPPFECPVKRLVSDGRFLPASQVGDLGLISRPIITQISRWDRLKGWMPLLDAFVELKRSTPPHREPLQQRRLDLTRLVLAGPDPAAIADDPEGKAVLEELCGRWLELPPDLQEHIAVLSLPMESRKENALIVNVLQRCSTIVVQNSLREGFGLTVTEAMNKACFVVGTNAAGIRAQINDGINGRLVRDPQQPYEIAAVLRESLADPLKRKMLGRNARRRVGERYLTPSQLQLWLRLIRETVAAAPAA